MPSEGDHIVFKSHQDRRANSTGTGFNFSSILLLRSPIIPHVTMILAKVIVFVSLLAGSIALPVVSNPP